MFGLALKKTWKELLSGQICNDPFTSRGVTKSVGSSPVTTSLSADLSSCAPPKGETESQIKNYFYILEECETAIVIVISVVIRIFIIITAIINIAIFIKIVITIDLSSSPTCSSHRAVCILLADENQHNIRQQNVFLLL